MLQLLNHESVGRMSSSGNIGSSTSSEVDCPQLRPPIRRWSQRDLAGHAGGGLHDVQQIRTLSTKDAALSVGTHEGRCYVIDIAVSL